MKWSVEAIVWDFDGVVVDTGRDIANAGNWVLRELGLPEQPVETIVSYIGGGAGPLVRRMLGDKAEKLADQAKSMLLARYGEYYCVETDLYPGMREVLEHYHGAGKAMGVATNKVEKLVDGILSKLDLEKYFGVVIGPDSITNRKPHPETVFKILGAFEIEPQRAVMIGDTAADIGAGKNAGTLTVGVTYGFGSRQEIVDAQPDAIIDSALELLEYVE